MKKVLQSFESFKFQGASGRDFIFSLTVNKLSPIQGDYRVPQVKDYDNCTTTTTTTKETKDEGPALLLPSLLYYRILVPNTKPTTAL
jgi:hypothetical protein